MFVRKQKSLLAWCCHLIAHRLQVFHQGSQADLLLPILMIMIATRLVWALLLLLLLLCWLVYAAAWRVAL